MSSDSARNSGNRPNQQPIKLHASDDLHPSDPGSDDSGSWSFSDLLDDDTPPPGGLSPELSLGDGDTGLERRRGPGRRRSSFMKSAEEGEMTTEQFLFIRAIDAFKHANNRMYPTWTDVLEVVRLLGYRKTLPCELNLRGVEDFKEAADAPANVRRTSTGAVTAKPPASTTEPAKRKAA
jgi:hypothetical protein